jgi:hypothetical protein
VPSPAAALASIATALGTLTSASRLLSDYRSDLQTITSGGIAYQLRGLTGGKAINSAEEKAVLAVRVDVHRRLTTAETERSYTEGVMQTHLASLLSPAWWKAIGGVHHVDPVPALETDDVRRVGRVVSYAVTVGLTLETA